MPGKVTTRQLAIKEVTRQRKPFQTMKPSRGCWNSAKIALAAIPALFKRGDAIHVIQPACEWQKGGGSAYHTSHAGPLQRGGIHVRSDYSYAWSDCFSVQYYDPCRELPNYEESGMFMGHTYLSAYPAPSYVAGFQASQEQLDNQNSISIWHWREIREFQCFPERVRNRTGYTSPPPSITPNITNATSPAPVIDSQIAPVHDDSAIAAGLVMGIGTVAIAGAVGLALAAYKCYKDYRNYKVVPTTMEFHRTEEGRTHVQGFTQQSDDPITLQSRSVSPSPSVSLAQEL